MTIFRRDARTATEQPPRPPECRPAAEDAWAFGASHAPGRGLEGDPCGSPPLVKISSDEEGPDT